MRIKPQEIILNLKSNNLIIGKTASYLSIHRTTVWRRKRISTIKPGVLSSRGLRRKTTRPISIKKVLTSNERIDIEKLRIKTGWTAKRITKKLNLYVASRTVHKFLKEKGFVGEYGYCIRPRFQDTLHMHLKNTKTIGYLQMDAKYLTPELTGLPWTCFEFAVINIFSRYKEAVILNHLDQDASILALLDIIPKLPFKPVFLQTDNGLEFQERFRKHVLALNMKYHYIHKNTPNEFALIERNFRTDEEEFFFRLEKRPDHYDDLRDLFTVFIHDYNYERPHLGINLKTPYQVIKEQLNVTIVLSE